MTVHVTGASSDAKILSYSWYPITDASMVESAGTFMVVGELQNVGTSNIFYVNVLSSVYVDDVEVARSSNFAFCTNILPGNKSPFYIPYVPEAVLSSVDLENFAWTDITDVKVTIGTLVNTDKNGYQDLTVTSDGKHVSGVYTVTGKVENVGTETISDMQVVTVFYNADGDVINLNCTNIYREKLKPASSLNFTATPFTFCPSGAITKHEVFAQSVNPQYDDPNTSNPSNIKTPSTSVTPPKFTVSPSDKGNGLSINTIIIIVVTILAIAAISTILVIRNRKKPDK